MGDDTAHNLLDETIHQRTRLAIMVTLAGVESLEFNELKAELGLTHGNLSAHLTTLERAAYVGVRKSFRGRKPLTTLSLTPKGRTALENYVRLLQEILSRPGKGPREREDKGTGEQGNTTPEAMAPAGVKTEMPIVGDEGARP